MASLVQRGENYYVQWRVGTKIKRRSLRTDNLQIAKEKLRQFESARIRGDDLPLPTRTKLPEILERYAGHVRTTKTPKSAQTDVYYLRQMFGPICPALQINSRKASIRAMKRPPKPGLDRRFKMSTIDVSHLEEITTTDVANFIGNHVRSRGLAPKTVREAEAEAVAFVVCHGIGLDTNTASSDYIQLYDGDKETLMRSLERIQRTAATILGAVLDKEPAGEAAGGEANVAVPA